MRTVRVPLDRSGALAGRVDLHVARVARARRRGAFLMYLSGGPGGAGVYEMITCCSSCRGLPRGYTVIGFDQRGTGASGLLRCKELERDGRLRSTDAAERCAQRLDPGARSTRLRTPSRTWRRSGARSARGS